MVNENYELGPARSQGLVDILDRILDKGLVVAGDIRIRLADVELLTIQIRLLVCSVEKAEEIGLDWWRDHRFLTSEPGAPSLSGVEAKVDRLVERIQQLETEARDRPQ